MLKKKHLIQFGGAEPVEGKPIAVCGAGTGLGVAHLVHVDERWVSLPGEGGDVDFAPNSEEEGIILEILRAEIGHVSAERVLSECWAGEFVSRDCESRQPPARKSQAKRYYRTCAG